MSTERPQESAPLTDPNDALDEMIAREFGEPTQSEFYPGSKTKRSAPPRPLVDVLAEPDDERWDARPLVRTVRGKQVEFFTIGQFARALNRRPVTIRAWEMKGVIPLAKYRTPDNKRLYTRRQVEGMIDICRRHGALDFVVRPEAKTLSKEFTAEAIALFQEPL